MPGQYFDGVPGAEFRAEADAVVMAYVEVTAEVHSGDLTGEYRSPGGQWKALVKDDARRWDKFGGGTESASITFPVPKGTHFRVSLSRTAEQPVTVRVTVYSEVKPELIRS